MAELTIKAYSYKELNKEAQKNAKEQMKLTRDGNDLALVFDNEFYKYFHYAAIATGTKMVDDENCVFQFLCQFSIIPFLNQNGYGDNEKDDGIEDWNGENHWKMAQDIKKMVNETGFDKGSFSLYGIHVPIIDYLLLSEMEGYANFLRNLIEDCKDEVVSNCRNILINYLFGYIDEDVIEDWSYNNSVFYDEEGNIIFSTLDDESVNRLTHHYKDGEVTEVI